MSELGNDLDTDLSLPDATSRGNNEGHGRGNGDVAIPRGRDIMSDQVKSDNVVSLGDARAQTLFPALGRVEAYWEALRDGRSMPARAEIDPRGIASVLENAFVLELVAPGVARIRLAGMLLNDLMAMEVRGMPLTAMFLPEARRELQQVIENVLETAAVVRLTLGSDKGFTRPPLEGQMMLLPLRDAHGHATRILGVLETRGQIGRGPRRLMIRDIETKVITADPDTCNHDAIGGFRPAPAPKPAVKPVPVSAFTTDAERRFDDFAPRTRDLARRVAERLGNDLAGGRGDDLASGAGRRLGHLRLVHDADTV